MAANVPRRMGSGLRQPSLSDPIRMIVFGGTGVGKSSFVNDASRGNLVVGHDLRSSTKEAQSGPIFMLDGRAVQLFDTPGFDDTTLTDTEVLQSISTFLVDLQNSNQKITGLLYLHRITDNRMNGASIRAFELFKKVCGAHNMRNAVIVTNMWSYPPTEEERAREAQLMGDFFRPAIQDGATPTRRGGLGPESAREIVRLLMNRQPIELQIVDELLRQGLQLDETEAGVLVDKNLRVRLERQVRERAELDEELQAAYEEQDRRAQEQLERYRRDREEEERVLRRQLDMLRSARRQMAMGPRGGISPIETQPPHQPGADFSAQPGRPMGWGRGPQPPKGGRDPAANTRSASLEVMNLSRTEPGEQERPQPAPPTPPRRRGFRFRSRLKMIYSRRARGEARGRLGNGRI